MTNHYPGYDTEIFLMLDGTQQGPFKGLAEVYRLGIAPDTPVWYEGLADWTPAIIAPLTRPMFEPGFALPDQPESEYVELPEPPAIPEPPVMPEAPAAPAQPAYTPQTSTRFEADKQPVAIQEPPKAYLAWSIVMTLLCCLPAGVIAIIFSCQVNSKMRRGDVDGAFRASERAQLWIVLSFILGLIWSIASLFLPFGLFA